jgi:hypothetical protein
MMQFYKTTMPPSHAAGTVQSWFEEHKRELQHPPYKILLETVRNLYESIPRRIAAVLKEKGSTTPYK